MDIVITVIIVLIGIGMFYILNAMEMDDQITKNNSNEVDKKLKDKDFKRNLDEMDQLKKNFLMHNARGAGRKAKFTDDQVDEIRRLREDGNTIKEIAKRYNCSVGLIHKLINEK